MFMTQINIQGTEETITNNILIQVGQDIKKLLGVSEETKLFIDNDEHETVDRVKDSNQTVHDLASPRRDYLSIEYSEIATDGYELSLVPNHDSNYPIYYDEEINSKISPIMQRRTFTLNCVYFNKSKSKVNAIANRLRLMSTNDGMYINHDLTYHYVLQTYLLMLLNNINELKNVRLIDPVDLETYISNTFDDRVNYVNSLDGLPWKADVSIREIQTQVLGYITNELHNITKTELKDKSGWTLEFEYKFDIEKPISLYLQYPMLVYNTLIDKQYINKFEPTDSNKGLRTKDATALQELAYNDRKSDLTRFKDYIRIPYEDSYIISSDLPGYKKILSTISIVNENDLRELFFIEDIPKVSFTTGILELMKLEKDYIFKKQRSIFIFELFNNNKKVYDTNIILTEEDVNGVTKIKLSTDKDLLITGYYRVVISFMYDLSYLTESDLKRIDGNIKDLEIDNPNLVNIVRDGLVSLYNVSTRANPYLKDIAMSVTTPERTAMKTVAIYNTTIVEPKL